MNGSSSSPLSDADLVALTGGIISEFPLFNGTLGGIPLCPLSCKAQHKATELTSLHRDGTTILTHLQIGFLDEEDKLATMGMLPSTCGKSCKHTHWKGACSIHVCEAARLADPRELRDLIAHELVHAVDYVIWSREKGDHNSFFRSFARKLNTVHGTRIAMHQTLRVRNKITKPCRRCAKGQTPDTCAERQVVAQKKK